MFVSLPFCKKEYLQVQLIDQFAAKKAEDIDPILWERKKILTDATLYFNAWVR